MAAETTARLRLRPGVQIVRAGPRSFLLLNPQTGAQLTCGAEERYLLHLLERCASLDEVRDAFTQRFGPGLAERPLLEFVEQLRQFDLLADADEPTPAPAVPPPPVAPPPAPLSAADPQAALNRFFDHLAVLFGWVTHPGWIGPILVLVLLAATALAQRGEWLLPSLTRVRQWLPPLPLLIALPLLAALVVSLPYSLFVGIVCRQHGGRVRAFGLGLFERVLPYFSCECGDSVHLMSERGQWTLLAGRIWYLLALASSAVLAWAMCKPGGSPASFWAWLLVPCAVGLVGQCVPFFQGGVYWMICKVVEEPRLQEEALAETRAWLAWRRSPRALTRDQRYWFRVYGLGYGLFRLVFDPVVVLGLGYVIVQRFRGVGALVYAALVLWWYRETLGRVLMSILSWSWLVRGGGPWWVRWPIRLGLVAGVVALGFVPYSQEIVGECRILPTMQYGVRAQLADEITTVHVKEGDHVPPGGLIATLSGRPVRESFLAAEAEVARAQANLDLLKAGYREEDINVLKQKVQLHKIRVEYYDKEMQLLARLRATNAASQEQYDRYKSNHEQSQEQLLGAQEALNKLTSGYREEEIRAAAAALRAQQEKRQYYEEQMNLLRVTTPFGGRVITPYMEQKRGQHARPGELLCVLQDISRLRVEVAASDAAGAEVKPGMRVHIRLYALDGRLLTGKVQRVALTAEQDRTIGLTPVSTEQEAYQEQVVNARAKSGTSYHVRVYVELDEYPEELKPDMTGYARIVVNEDAVLWQALARPVARFLRTEVWSWLP